MYPAGFCGWCGVVASGLAESSRRHGPALFDLKHLRLIGGATLDSSQCVSYPRYNCMALKLVGIVSSVN